MRTSEATEDQQLTSAVLRLNGTVHGLAFGLAGGLILFFATIVLVLRGGEDVGAHLGLLSQFFYGYDVTLLGSFVGFIYGFLTGFVGGWLTAWIYNRVVLVRTR